MESFIFPLLFLDEMVFSPTQCSQYSSHSSLFLAIVRHLHSRPVFSVVVQAKNKCCDKRKEKFEYYDIAKFNIMI